MNKIKTNEFVGKIMKLNRLHRSVIGDGTDEFKLRRSVNLMLIYISQCKAPPSQKDIAESFDITPAAVAMALKKMEMRGLIMRTPSESDNRINLIELSDAGRELLEKNKQRFDTADKVMLDGIDEKDLVEISKILDKMIANLVNAGAKDEPPPFAPENHKSKCN